jgi:hypothetical protein
MLLYVLSYCMSCRVVCLVVLYVLSCCMSCRVVCLVLLYLVGIKQMCSQRTNCKDAEAQQVEFATADGKGADQLAEGLKQAGHTLGECWLFNFGVAAAVWVIWGGPCCGERQACLLWALLGDEHVPACCVHADW